jgi:cyanophycinase
VGEEPGLIALLGGGEWQAGCEPVDEALLAAAGTDQVTVLPTAAAFERPERAVEHAEAYFARLGAKVRPLMVLRRADAQDPAMAEAIGASRFVYLGGGSPLHLRSVLKDSAVWAALVRAWQAGAVVAGSSAGAMVLTDPMVDPRGGALTVGLGLVRGLAVVPHYGQESAEKVHRSVTLAAADLAVVGVPERTAVLRDPSGSWQVLGAGDVQVFVGGEPADLDALPRG